ncbi:hypothetical protein MTR67_018359, partial [Solanum verrucosum]
RVKLPGTTLRVPEDDPNPWLNKLPRHLKNTLGGSMSTSWTSSTKGEKSWSASRTCRGLLCLKI